MPSRGPGKFNDDLDAALYALTLDGGPDEEVGSSTEAPGTWAGLMRDGGELVKAIEDRFKDGEPFSLVSKGELMFLDDDGAAGVIITESTEGFVEVVYYKDEDKLDKDWAECVEDLSLDEEFEENSRPKRNGKLPKAYSKYGADMGRASTPLEGEVTLERVALDEGGYDSGGAYWGTGTALWRATDEHGGERFFRAKTKADALHELEGHDVREAEDETSKLEHDGTLLELLRGAAESEEFPGEEHDLELTDELRRAAHDYERDLWTTLSMLVRDIPPAEGDAQALFEEGDAPYLVYMTLVGSGHGIYDGDWDRWYDSDLIEEKVRPFIEARMGKWADDAGTGKLVTALHNAVYDNEQRLKLEGDEQNENRRSNRGTRVPNGSNAWRVTLRGEETDIVFFDDRMDADEVRRSLIEHDGYDPAIKVKLRERRRTRAPDALAENRRHR